MKYVFVTGGVVSGLGKGITAASVGLLLKSFGYEVTNVKIDMYLNVDAGTIRPLEHGEVFVTDDGIETDQDIGNYERFLNCSLKRDNYMTTGQVYLSVIQRERAFGYGGEDVEAIPHLTDEIIRRIKRAGRANSSNIVIIELGGTVGEYQNGIFYEASRILRLKQPKDVIQIHVSYLPVIKSLGELKSKPAQQSVHILNSMGIQPDILIARSEKAIDQRRRERLAMFCNMNDKDIIANPDMESIYEVPLYMEEQKVAEKILKKLGLRKKKRNDDLTNWKNRLGKIRGVKKELRVAIVGKYFKTGNYMLSDTYVCVIEALKHAGAENGVKILLDWIDADELKEEKCNEVLSRVNGIIVPQGWGSRGVEGKLLAVKYARENRIPYLGLCFGMQMAVIEFARNVCGLSGANSTEVDPKTKFPVVHIMPDQAEYLRKKQYGGTIRLGAWPCNLKKDSLLRKVYGGVEVIEERHRHRYEVNQEYRKVMENKGLIFSGMSPDGRLVEAVELNQKIHPFFVATQFHPEYKSRFLLPHPLFIELVKACLKSE